MSDSDHNQQPRRGWARLGELGPAWITAIAALIVALTSAGFFAGRATSEPTVAAKPAKTLSAKHGSASSSAPAVPGQGSSQPAAPAGNSTYLADLSSLSGGSGTGDAAVNGQDFPTSVIVEMNPGPGDVAYNLGRSWQRFEATIGLDDSSPEGEKVQFQVVADGHSLYTHVFSLGQSVAINLNVTGVLRLELKTTLASSYINAAEAVWGNASLTN